MLGRKFSWVLFGVLAIAIALSSPAFAGKGKGRAEPAKKSRAGHIKKFKVTAFDGKIHPETLRVHRGDRVNITFVSKDGHYAIKMKEFGIKEHFRKDESVTVELVATEKGVFNFRCTKFWSFKHWSKNGTLVVK